MHPAAGLVIAGLVVRITCGAPVRACEHPLPVWLGGISFSLYLWHYPILDRGLAQLDRRLPTGLVGLVALSLVLVAVAASVVLHRVVEVPAARRRRGRRRGPTGPRARTSP